MTFSALLKRKPNKRGGKVRLQMFVALLSFLPFYLVFHQFPPVELPKSQSSALLRNFDVKNAETLTIESTHIDLTQNDPIEPEISPPKPQIILKEIPDDNSCLFNAIGYLLENHSLNKAQELRSSK